MIQIKRNGIMEFTFIISAFIGLVLLIFTGMGVTDEVPVIIWMWILMVGSAFVYCGLAQILQDRSQLIVVYAGDFVRCVLVFLMYMKENISLSCIQGRTQIRFI